MTPPYGQSTPPGLDLVCGSIAEFLEASGHADDWPEFEARVDEMNHQEPNGSRTGDIFLVMPVSSASPVPGNP